MKKLYLAVLLFVFTFTMCACTNESKYLKSWNEDSTNMNLLVEYVKDVTNEKSENYIPKEDRIAVFDMDGTLYSETNPNYIEVLVFLERVLNDESYTPSNELKNSALKYKRQVEEGTYDDDGYFGENNGKAFDGFTMDEYDEYVNNFVMNTYVPGFNDLTYKNAWFKPMLEVVDYLNANDFTTYICSATERATCRALASNVVNIDPSHIIGEDIKYRPDNYEGRLLDSFQYDLDSKVVRSSKSNGTNKEGAKVEYIIKQIGKVPVLAFGNSKGDTSMGIFALNNDKYRSMTFMVMGDDNERDNNDIEKYEKRKELWDELGFNVISIKDEFKTIYGEDIEKINDEENENIEKLEETDRMLYNN